MELPKNGGSFTQYCNYVCKSHFLINLSKKCDYSFFCLKNNRAASHCLLVIKAWVAGETGTGEKSKHPSPESSRFSTGPPLSGTCLEGTSKAS